MLWIWEGESQRQKSEEDMELHSCGIRLELYNLCDW
jgi:hypothetical protein